MRKTLLAVLTATLCLAQTAPKAAAPKTAAPSTAAKPPAGATGVVATKEFQDAIDNMRRGNIAAAEPVLTKLFKAQPTNPDLLLAMGTLYSLKGDLAQAVDYMERAVKAKPTSQAYAGLAAAYGDAGRIEETVAALKKSLSLDPTNMSANFNLATIYMQMSAYSEAAPLLEKVIKLKPTELDSQYLLAVCYSAMNRPADARTLLLKMPPAAREAEQVLLLLGSASAALGEKAQAYKYFEHALEQNPISGSVLTNLGALLVRDGQMDRGIEMLDRAYRADKTSYLAGFTLASAYRDAGKNAEARSVLGTLLTKGETPDIYAMLGQVEDSLGNHATAVGYFQRAIDMDPNTEGYTFVLGASHIRAGKADIAISLFKIALDGHPLSIRLRLGLGAAYLGANKNAESVDTLQPLSDAKDSKEPLGPRLYELAKQAAAGSRDEAKIKAAFADLK